jgi:hypothetical protein
MGASQEERLVSDQVNPFVALLLEFAFVLAMFLFGQWVLTVASGPSGAEDEPVGSRSTPYTLAARR